MKKQEQDTSKTKEYVVKRKKNTMSLGWWMLSTAALAGAIVWAYVVVLFDALGAFPLTNHTARSGYLDSPYWLGMARTTTTFVAVLQVFAACGFVAWQISLVLDPPSRGLLADTRFLIAFTALFLVSSAAWPFAAYRVVEHPRSLPWALVASSTLWSAAAGVLALVGGTFEDRRASPVALVGILCLAVVVVLADGVGWSAVAIRRALYGDENP